MTTREMLADVARRAADYLESLAERPVGSRVALEAMRAALGGDLPERGEARREGGRAPRRGGRSGHRGLRRTALLRLRGRRLAAGRRRRRLADHDLGPERRPLRPLAGELGLRGESPGAGWSSCSACPRRPASASSPAARRPTSRRSPPRATPCSSATAGTSRRGACSARRRSRWWSARRPTSPSTPRSRCSASGRDRVRAGALPTARGGCVADAARSRRSRRSPGGRRSSARRRATSTPARSIRSTRSPTLRRAQGAWLHVDGAFGLWAAASPALAPSAGGRRARRLLGDRRPQVAQRPVRLGHRALRPPGGAPRGADHLGLLPRPDAGRRARPLRVDAGVLAARARLRGLGRAPVARPARRGRPGRALLRARPPLRRAARRRTRASRSSTRSCSTRCWCASRRPAAATPRRPTSSPAPSSGACRRTGTLWLSGTTWHGRAAMRISVSNWSTGKADVERSAAAILAAAGR